MHFYTEKARSVAWIINDIQTLVIFKLLVKIECTSISCEKWKLRSVISKMSYL
jgi:hypothetical protein